MRIPAARFSDAARSQVRTITFRTRGPQAVAAAPAGAPTDAPVSTPGPDPSVKGKLRASGMLRKLESGGFNGVADLRHRIRHGDQLKERAEARAADTFVGSAKSFFTRISDVTLDAVSGLAEDGEARRGVSAALETFRSEVRDTAMEAARSGTVNTDDLAATLGAALDDLLGALGAALAPTEAAGATGTAGPALDVAVPGKQTPSDVRTTDVTGPVRTDAAAPRDATELAAPGGADALADLSALFDGVLDALVGRVSEALELPEPAPAHGNGRAFAKFSAMLAARTTGPEPSVDATG